MSADDMAPSLVLNNRLPGFSQNVQDDPLLQGVLLPAALRIVLQEIAAEPVREADEEQLEGRLARVLQEQS